MTSLNEHGNDLFSHMHIYHTSSAASQCLDCHDRIDSKDRYISTHVTAPSISPIHSDSLGHSLPVATVHLHHIQSFRPHPIRPLVSVRQRSFRRTFGGIRKPLSVESMLFDLYRFASCILSFAMLACGYWRAA